jgi:elongation factor 1 alpha-like protein
MSCRFETPARRVTLLDAPGHKEFVPSMIAGAAQADAALLVVDGSPGGFEAGFSLPAAPTVGTSPFVAAGGGGQTREHAQLARSLGVEQLAVVVTKLDCCEFPQPRFEEIKARLAPFLSEACGFKASAVQWLPAVGPTGENLVSAPTDAKLKAWWRGPTLVQVIEAFRPAQRRTAHPLRMTILEAGKSSGRGGAATSVTGKVEAGAVRPGDRVTLVPGGADAVVKTIEVDGRAAVLARAGDSAELGLVGVDPTTVARGDVVCDPGWPAPVVGKFQARVVVLDAPVPLLRGQAVTLHSHAAHQSGRVSALLSLLDASTGEVKRAKPRCLSNGQSGTIEVTPDRPMCVEMYSECRSLGRVALREGGRTLAVGVVTDVWAPEAPSG